MKQRQLKVFGLIIVGALFLCDPLGWSAEAAGKPENSHQHPRLIMILVDMSGSADQARHTVCKEAFEKIYKNLRHGDRVIVGTIASQSYIDFKPTVDEEILQAMLRLRSHRAAPFARGPSVCRAG